MTEEDQILVAKAVLAGVRFSRSTTGYWLRSTRKEGGSYTVGRAAAMALLELELMTREEQRDYDHRTYRQSGPVDVDCGGW